MNGLPNGIDQMFFRQTALTQVCVGRHEVILVFDNNTHVTIESEVTISLPHKKIERLSDCPLVGAQVVEILGQTIRSVEVLDGKDLKIGFDNASLIVHDSNSAYESFVITNGEKTIVV